MENLKVYCRGSSRGEASFRADGERLVIRVTMKDPGDGLYRAVLCGEGGQLALGILEPKNAELCLCRRPCRRDVEGIGRLRCVEAVCSFPFQKKNCWEVTQQPAEFFVSGEIKDRLRGIETAWFRREGGRLLLALELRFDSPFPLEMLFCLGRVRTVEGRRCVVYEFDGEGRPVQAKNGEKERKTSGM